MTTPKKTSAVEKLQRSQLSKKSVQAELMGDDLDLAKLLVYLKGKIKFDSVDSVTDVNVTRTIEGASTVVVNLVDPQRQILNSGLLNSGLDIQLDGLWFRLVKVGKQGTDLTLTFEDREVAVLRTYKKHKVVHRSNATRAEFINNLIREVKEFRIPVVIPELHKVQPIQSVADLTTFLDNPVADKSGGIPSDLANAQDLHRHDEFNKNTTGQTLRPTLTVKGHAADKDQIRNANIILATGQSMGVRRKVLVCSIMTVIQESTLRNLPYGDRDSLGLFQQRASWGTAEERLDPATAARMFFNKAKSADAADPTRPYWDLCQAVQVSADATAYAQWRTEAERFVAAYGIPGGDLEGSASDANNMNALALDGANYIFYRGQPLDGGKKWKPEDSWACIQRLAEEVQWRAFMVSGTFYYIAEDDLFKSKPIITVTETSQGIEQIDGDYDTGKANATATITARVGTWLVPPGAIVVLQHMGPWNGRWLVSDFTRSLFDSKATITLKKPQPRLSEPAENDINQLPPTWAINTATDVANNVVDPLFGGILPDNLKGTRAGIVEIAEHAVAEQAKKPYHYLQKRPYPDTLWSDEAHAGIDCSAFVTLVYKEASCPDPNGLDYNGTGFTGTLWSHGIPTLVPQPGDMVFYLGDGTRQAPGHVAIFVGDNKVIEIGSNAGVSKLPYNYRGDILGYRSYLAAS